MYGIGPLGLLILGVAVGTSVWLGVNQGRREGFLIGAGSAWFGLVAWSVLFSVIGNFLGSETFMEGLGKNWEMLNPFNLQMLFTVVLLGAPGFFCFWLKHFLDIRRGE